MDVLSISVRTGVMTALEHLSSLVERSINHKIYHHTVQVIFLTVILRVKQVEKGRMKLEICTHKHSLRREIKISWLICDPPQDFNSKGESTRTTRFHFKTKEFILTRFSTLAILPY